MPSSRLIISVAIHTSKFNPYGLPRKKILYKPYFTAFCTLLLFSLPLLEISSVSMIISSQEFVLAMPVWAHKLSVSGSNFIISLALQIVIFCAIYNLQIHNPSFALVNFKRNECAKADVFVL